MKIAKFIVIGALLGTMSQIEVVEAVQIQSQTLQRSELAHKSKKHHKKHHKKHQQLAQDEGAGAAEEKAETSMKEKKAVLKEAADAAEKPTKKKAPSKVPAGGEPKVEKKELPAAAPLKSVADQKDIDETYDAGKVIKTQKAKEEGKEDDVKGDEKKPEPEPVPTQSEKEKIVAKKVEIQKLEDELKQKKEDLDKKEAEDVVKKAKEDEEEEETQPEYMKSAQKEEEEKAKFNGEVEVLAKEGEINHAKALQKEADKKALKELKIKEDAEAAAQAVKDARAYKKKTLANKADTEDTAEVTQEKEIAKSKKRTFPKKESPVVEAAMKALDMTTPEKKEEDNMKDKDDKANKAVAVGKQQEENDKIEASAKKSTHSTDEIWTANMPGDLLAQKKSTSMAQQKAKEDEEEEEESDEEEDEDEDKKDDEEEEESSDDEDDDLHKKKQSTEGNKKTKKSKKAKK